MYRVFIICWGVCGIAIASCKYPALPLVTGDATHDTGGADSGSSSFALTVSPTSVVLHLNETRVLALTVANATAQTAAAPTFAATGLTLGTITFDPGTCTTALAPHQTCSTTAQLTSGTSGGSDDVQIVVTANPLGAIAPVSLIVPCVSTCGAAHTVNCCQTALVPGNATGATNAGDLFYRSYDQATGDMLYKDMSSPATVSDFQLDTYDVTVGRFRAFVGAGMGTQASAPMANAGAHAKIAGSGWDTTWNQYLAADKATLLADLACDATHETWTDTAAANENLPINCVSWYEAFAFCTWDGGYLPTEAEWNYAAAGGSFQRPYPWGPAASTAIDCSHANYQSATGTYCTANANAGATDPVGSQDSSGNARWGHTDLAGNVYNWVLDWYETPYPTVCDDCANLTQSGTFGRVLRGGSYRELAPKLRTGFRYKNQPGGTRYADQGFRCARSP